MMKLLDWKFLVMLAATLAGVMVPVWLWRAELDSRSLRFIIVSKTSLQPAIGTEVPELKLTFNGVELLSPALTVVRLSNDGAKPIPASDFEGALRLTISGNAKLVRASATKLNPPDLLPVLTTTSNSVGIAPLLLNPGDSITFELLTSGTPEALESRARISGLHAVPVEDGANHTLRPPVLALAVAAAFVCMISAGFFISNLPTKGTYLRPRAAIVVTLVSASVGMSIIGVVLDKLGFESGWQLLVVGVVLLLVADLVGSVINRPPSQKKGAEKAD